MNDLIEEVVVTQDRELAEAVDEVLYNPPMTETVEDSEEYFENVSAIETDDTETYELEEYSLAD